MKNKKSRKLIKRRFLPKGTPYPGEPQMKFVDASLTSAGAEKIANRIQENDHNAQTLIQPIPKQNLVYKRHYKPRRLTPKTPRLR